MADYNVRVLQYPNGEVVLRHYSECLSKDVANEYEDAKITDDDYFLPDKSKGKVRSPFDNKIVREVLNFDDLEDRQRENELRSYNRTRQKVYDYSRCCSWEWFLTFTFSPDKIDRYNYEACSKAIRKWLNNQKRNAPDLKYLVVPEVHTGETYLKRGLPLPDDYEPGAFHFHSLVCNTGSMKFVESGHFTKSGDVIYSLGKWSLGWSTATKVKDLYKSSNYLCKYITKDLCDLTKGKHRYFVSTNIEQPKSFLFLVEDDEDLKDLQERLCGSLGVELQHMSCPRYDGAFMYVDYYTYREVEYDT